MNKEFVKGNILATITIIIWGTTYISTKVLLNDFSPTEILFIRFLIGFITLKIIYPKRLKITNSKHEFYFIFAGLTGVTLYFMLENIALTYTLASSVGIITSIIPFFTAILTHIFLKNEKLNLNFFIGFVVSMIGVTLICLNGKFILKVNPLGDILAIGASLVWSIYSVIGKKISTFNYNSIQTTRKTFLYGLIFMIPFMFFLNFNINFYKNINVTNGLNILFLGLGASALCFVTWNIAVKILGAVKTTAYIYAVPVITVITSAIILKENITLVALIGITLALSGLFITNIKQKNDISDECEKQSESNSQ